MGIPIVYFRSSSFNAHRFCEQQYLIEYFLGWRGPSNKKADKGTIVHKVLEIAAIAKKAAQDGHQVFYDEITGETKTADYRPKYLEELIEKVYEHYSKAFSHHIWSDKDLKDCKEWVWKALTINKGKFDPRNMQIVEPEAHFDIELDEDWAVYEHKLEDGTVLKGRLSLKGTIDLISDLGDGVYEVVDWKGLPVETALPTPNGWTTMSEIKKGDFVFDKDGNPTKVIGKSRAKYKQCYKITFDDANSVICDNEHLWYLDDDRTVSVTELEVGDKIDITKPLNTDDIELPIDPYVLGVWLGDGRNRSMEISSSDNFIFEEIERRGYRLGKNLEKRNNKLVTKVVYRGTQLLKKLNLIHNKHIPEIYLRASYNQRLDLLRGLMDTDGNANKTRKQAVFTTCNSKLSDDTKELILSLGQRVNQCHIKRKTNFSNDKIIDIFPLHFRPININPFLMPRKRDQVDPEWGPGLSNKRRIQKIELMGAEYKTQCIMVDSPTNTYLCTENFIPTHNTGKRLDWATGQIKDQEKLWKDPQLRLYHLALSKLYPDVKTFLITIYFINDGGPYTVHFQDKDLEKTKEMVRKKFEYIKRTTKPILIKEKNPSQSWKCGKLCHAGMSTFEGTDIEPIYIPRYKRFMTKCEQVRYMIQKKGVEWVVQNYPVPGFNFASYKAPGSIE